MRILGTLRKLVEAIGRWLRAVVSYKTVGTRASPVVIVAFEGYHSVSSIRLMTMEQLISLLAASGMTTC